MQVKKEVPVEVLRFSRFLPGAADVGDVSSANCPGHFGSSLNDT